MLGLHKHVDGGKTIQEAMKLCFGWTKDDFERYIGDTSSHIAVADAKPKADDFRLQLGSTIKRGGVTFDTSEMFSKFKGSGFAIYVMDGSGAIYADRHKVSLFHHSSFLGGGSVSGAGEMRVEGGKLVHLTNKSGHYTPGFEEMAATLLSLRGAQVDLAGTEITVIYEGNLNGVEYPGKAAGFLRDYEQGGPDLCKQVAEGESTRLKDEAKRKKQEAATA